MKKAMKLAGLCILAAAAIRLGSLADQKQLLRQEFVRLHVVAASDSQEDQQVKLLVRDALVESLGETMGKVADADQAKDYLRENLPMIEGVANRVLTDAGVGDRACVSLGREPFPVRHYDTFSLPSGLYDALRVTIGAGEGHNWWCVVFPALCVGETAEDFEAAADCAGMPENLTGALSGEENYEARFFMLDVFGRLENFLYGR